MPPPIPVDGDYYQNVINKEQRVNSKRCYCLLFGILLLFLSVVVASITTGILLHKEEPIYSTTFSTVEVDTHSTDLPSYQTTEVTYVPTNEPTSSSTNAIKTTTDMVTQVSMECPAQFTKVGSMCYSNICTGVSWDEALQLCEQKGAALLGLETLQKYDAFIAPFHLEILGPICGEWYHLALKDQLQEGSSTWVFKWNSGAPYERSEANWEPGQPYEHIKYPCARMGRNVNGIHGIWGWRMDDCLTGYVMCEKELV